VDEEEYHTETFYRGVPLQVLERSLRKVVMLRKRRAPHAELLLGMKKEKTIEQLLVEKLKFDGLEQEKAHGIAKRFLQDRQDLQWTRQFTKG
jgi:hypothetical protein